MSEEELWRLRIELIAASSLETVFGYTNRDSKTSTTRKSRKMSGTGESGMVYGLQRWAEPDTSQSDRALYVEPYQSPNYEVNQIREINTGLVPMVPGYPPQLVPGIGLIPHVSRAFDYFLQGTKYHHTMDAQ
jgi:hypothetical protein